MNTTKTLIQAFLGGLVLIVGLRTLVTGLSGATLAASAAVAIIAFVGWRYHTAFDNPDDRQVAGDNLYYLGLLFTLISLILALLQLFVLDTQEDVNTRANELIGNFGIALFSTVAGIFARILFQSHQKESPEHSAQKIELHDGEIKPIEVNPSSLAIDADVRELREELANLRLVLREASDAFLHFSRISSEQSEAVVVHTGSMMQRQTEDLSETAVHQLEQMNSSLKSIADAFRDEMNTLSNHCSEVIDKFLTHMSTQANRGISDTSKAWNEAVVEMKAEGEKQIKAIYGDINTLLQSTERIWSKIAGLSESVSESVTGMQEHTDSLREMVKDSANAGRELKRLLESMNVARSELELTAGIATKSTREIEKGSLEFGNIQSKLATELDETRLKAVEEYRESTAQIAEHFSEQINDLENHQKISTEQLSNARQLSKQMSDESAEWSKLAEHTRKSLVEATEQLVNVVKKSD